MARVLHSGDTSWEECPGRGGRGRFLHFLFSLFISSDHVARLDPETFYFQFHNLLYAYGRNCSYICYRVKRWKHRSPVSFDWGVFHNQVRAPGNSSHLFGALELHTITFFLPKLFPCRNCFLITLRRLDSTPII